MSLDSPEALKENYLGLQSLWSLSITILKNEVVSSCTQTTVMYLCKFFKTTHFHLVMFCFVSLFQRFYTGGH